MLRGVSRTEKTGVIAPSQYYPHTEKKNFFFQCMDSSDLAQWPVFLIELNQQNWCVAGCHSYMTLIDHHTSLN